MDNQRAESEMTSNGVFKSEMIFSTGQKMQREEDTHHLASPRHFHECQC